MAKAMTLIQSQTLGSPATSVTFSSIPSGYRDLMVVVTGVITSGSPTDMRMQYNGDTGANYSVIYMSGTGSAAQSGAGASQTFAYMCVNVQMNTTGPGMWRTQILDYAATDKHKSALVRADASASTAATEALVTRWASTAAINSILIYPAAGLFATSCTFNLYGIAG